MTARVVVRIEHAEAIFGTPCQKNRCVGVCCHSCKGTGLSRQPQSNLIVVLPHRRLARSARFEWQMPYDLEVAHRVNKPIEIAAMTDFNAVVGTARIERIVPIRSITECKSPKPAHLCYGPAVVDGEDPDPGVVFRDVISLHDNAANITGELAWVDDVDKMAGRYGIVLGKRQRI